MKCANCGKKLPMGVRIGINKEYIPSWEELNQEHNYICTNPQS